MREIKFRALTIVGDGYKPPLWAYGDLLKSKQTIKEDDKTIYLIQTIFPIVNEEKNKIAYMSYYVSDNKTIGQYIGLHDKKGREIYEGDIVKIFYDEGNKYITGKVIYEGAGFTIDTTNNKKLLGIDRVGITEKFVEIIGDIYENPELLEED